MRKLALLVILVALHTNLAQAADDASLVPAADTPAAAASQGTASTYTGGVILDGRYIAPPYDVVAVAEGVEVNGHFVPEAGFNERAKKRRDATNEVGFADRIRTRLKDGGWLLGWDQGEYGMVSESRIGDILYVMSDDLSGDKKRVDELEALGMAWIEREDWRQLVERCELPAHLLNQFSGAPPADPALVAKIKAPELRFRFSIYLLTVFGMGATVFALGTLLSYRPVEKMPWSCVNISKDATHLVLRSVVLLVGLAVLDLICTTISAQTSSFWELNPFGAAALNTPLLLGTFKIGATLMSGSILFALRRYHGAQVASWWLALFCTVLAIRWVTFNSMFLA